jgi:hypothetical protein
MEEVDYIKRFAYLPTRLDSGWIWLETYWIKAIHFDPPVRMHTPGGYFYYVGGRYRRLSQYEREKDETIYLLTNQIDKEN